MSLYRNRIYQNYVHARKETLSPVTLEGLESRRPYLKKLIGDHFPPDRNASILDLGCGHGALIYYAGQKGYCNITGVDCSPQQVAETKRLGIDGVVEGDLMDKMKTLSKATQDLIITFDVIEHFNKNELIEFIDEVFRVLKAGGKWIIHCPNGESPFVGKILYGDFTHEMAFTRTSLA